MNNDIDNGKCPYCESGNLEGGSFDIDGPFVSQRVWCQDCEKSWIDVYQIHSRMLLGDD